MVKYTWLLLLALAFAVFGVYGGKFQHRVEVAPPRRPAKIPAVDVVEEKSNETQTFGQDPTDLFNQVLDNVFDNFTNFLQDRHPSISVPVKKFTTCIVDMFEINQQIKNLLTEIYAHVVIKKSDIKTRTKFCKQNIILSSMIMYCVASTNDGTGNEAFFSSFMSAIALVKNEFCNDPSLHERIIDPLSKRFDYLIAPLPKEYQQPILRFQELLNHGTKPTNKKDECLPVRVGESFEILAIQTHKFDFTLHGQIGNFMHFISTMVGNFPFKSYGECA